ncbi:MAG: SGNH/GDSL hydrolase family protein [Flavobacteriaceae bacterium]|nr:SGNH/GDSL hydrolase family protein [Flavobacteriaceae bacterium]
MKTILKKILLKKKQIVLSFFLIVNISCDNGNDPVIIPPIVVAPVIKTQTVFMGDSITESWSILDSAFFVGKHYINKGISGQTSLQMNFRFQKDVIDLKPAVVIIMAGTNDIAGNGGTYTPGMAFNNISSMAELAKTNNIKVILCSVLPATDFWWNPGLQPADKIIALNTMIRDYAVKNKIPYVDYYAALVDLNKGLPKKYSVDGVHPNLAGYLVMDPLAEKAITDILATI